MTGSALVLDGRDPAAVERAARVLADGELLAFPTETVYGLGARADDDEAVAKIFAAKGRPADHPLIVHVHSAEGARVFAREIPPVAQRLMAAWWPGSLTLILPRAHGMGRAAAGGQDSIGLRCPSHPTARELLAACEQLGVPGVAGPSANRFGRVSPTTAAHVAAEFGADVPVLDGGASEIGIESTIVDCSRGRLVLLRPGMLTPHEIAAVALEPVSARDAAAPRASGTLESHYAPRARVRLMAAGELEQACREFAAAMQASLASPGAPVRLADAPPKLGVYSRSVLPPAGSGIRHRRMPADAAAAAHELFAVLRAFDDGGVDTLWVEQLPPDASWDGVRDRLQRAAA